jgi:hypothetical protein
LTPVSAYGTIEKRCYKCRDVAINRLKGFPEVEMKRASVFLLLLPCFFSAPAAAIEFLNPEQIRKTVGGATIAHVNPITGNHVTLQFHADGTVASTGGRSGTMSDSGRWWVTGKGGQAVLCFHFPTAGLGKTPCFRLSRNGNELVRYLPNGTPAPGANFAIVAGGN